MMAQIFAPFPFKYHPCILCCYVNYTSKIQIARIANIANWYFERVVFPDQRLLFEAVAEAYLEIYTYVTPTTILSDKFLCARLRLNE